MGRGPAVIVENRGKTQKSMVLRAGVPQKYLTNARIIGKLFRVQNPRTKVRRIFEIRGHKPDLDKRELRDFKAPGGSRSCFGGTGENRAYRVPLQGPLRTLGRIRRCRLYLRELDTACVNR